jgi:hypothetical protein
MSSCKTPRSTDMAVFHIVRKDDPRFAVRTTRNRRSADFLLSGFGEDYEIVEDLCSDVRKKTVDVLAQHAYNVSIAIRGTDRGNHR